MEQQNSGNTASGVPLILWCAAVGIAIIMVGSVISINNSHKTKGSPEESSDIVYVDEMIDGEKVFFMEFKPSVRASIVQSWPVDAHSRFVLAVDSDGETHRCISPPDTPTTGVGTVQFFSQGIPVNGRHCRFTIDPPEQVGPITR